MGEWIDIRDRLPKDIGKYLIFMKTSVGGYTDLGWWTGKIWQREYSTDVSHWMLLPAAPKNGI